MSIINEASSVDISILQVQLNPGFRNPVVFRSLEEVGEEKEVFPNLPVSLVEAVLLEVRFNRH